MPRKRRSSGSGRSKFSSKIARKLSLNASSETNQSLEEGDEDTLSTKVSLSINAEETALDVNDTLAFISPEEVEESENENKKPEETGKPPSLSQLPTNTICLSPSKRASPLSPTLLDNVLLKQSQPVVSYEETEPNVTPVHSKVDNEDDQSLGSRIGTRSKRRHNFSEKNVSPNKPSDKDETYLEQKKDKNTIVGEKHKESTSQTPSHSGDRNNLPVSNYRILDNYQIEDASPPDPDTYRKWVVQTKEEMCREVLYELDELDISWLDEYNEERTKRHASLNLGKVTYEEMELLLDRFEKENYFELQNSGMGQPGESDEEAVCCICLDGESDNSNLIIFCDMCNIPVHQDCYGVPFIPEGSWLCRRCSISPNVDIECVFCPNKDGAFKQTVDGRWAHVLCALWIPEVRFTNPSLVEPVDDIDDIPTARWKLICFICKKKGVGACIQCHLRTCVTAFHATCAQSEGLSLKLETKESSSTNVRMEASCDKHTSAEVKEALKQTIETIKKVLDEKRAVPPVTQFPLISANRVNAISELVTFPGRLVFIKRLLAYWKIKRRSRGGAPLLRNVDMLYTQSLQEPPVPPKIESQHNPSLDESFLEKMQTLQTGLSAIMDYCTLIKNYCELQREDQELACKIDSLKLEAFPVFGVYLYLDILKKLGDKDKLDTFAQPVTCDIAPDYFNVITTAMDLSTMRNKALSLEYSSIDELEADFLLMINNCMTYNKKSTVYYKNAIKLKEYGSQVFEEARLRLTLSKESLDEDSNLEKNVETVESADASSLETDEVNDEHELLSPIKCRELKYQPLKGVLLNIIEQLSHYDKKGVFAEPVDVNKLPDYLTIVQNPMDFSTMRIKIDKNQYSCIEDLERDFFLMLDNCLQYNEENTRYYKLAEKMKVVGRNIFDNSKQKHYIPGLKVTENNNNYKTETDDVGADMPALKELTKDDMLRELTDVLNQLMASDDEQIFAEPVTDDDAPGYSDVIKSPMDLSLIEHNLKSSVYTCLEDMEKDFVLMISNCKKYNTAGTKYHNYATKIKRAGNSVFNAARKRLASTYKMPEVNEDL